MDMMEQMQEIMKRPLVLPYPEHLEITRKIAADGIVLLKNAEEILPLKTKTVALFGAGAVDTISCGTGSGYISAPHVVTVKEGMENAGFSLTSEEWLERFLGESRKANEEDTTLTQMDRIWSGKRILIDDIPITDTDLVKAKKADTAIYVIRRNAGEDDDRKAKKGDYYLTEREEENLRKITQNFENTIVVFNTCVMDASFLETITGIKGAVLMGLAGNECGNALADILSGKCSPCGKLTDTWARKYEDNPASAAFGRNDGNSLQEDYTEDIYVGYRYFDSFGVEPLLPFGYGLSYSAFQIQTKKIVADWKEISVEVEVINTGNDSGREVVQLYVTAPEGKLCKPFQELKAFGKTKMLKPGESENMTLSFPTESMASYDEVRAAFIMESGDYLFRIGTDSRHTRVAYVVRVEGEAVLRQVRNKVVPDRDIEVLKAPERSVLRHMIQKGTDLADLLEECFVDYVPDIVLLGTDCVTIDGTCKTREADQINKKRFEEVEPASSATLFDVKNGTVSMDAFVASLEPEVLMRLITGAANETPYETADRLHRAIKQVEAPVSSGSTTSLFVSTLGIPQWRMTDGPAGLHLTMLGATCFPTDIVVAQTWDPQMGFLMGESLGKEMVFYNQDVVLGPGMNIHRDPLCGRNFEYFSEDPVISGKMAAAVTKGVQSLPGTSVSIKHFVCNNQEADRFVTNSTVSERALREIYMKGFEICVREADPHTVMSSYNKVNGIHTSSNYELLTEVLRGEWGFRGLVMTDWGTRSEKAEDYHAGNDLVMGGYRTDTLMAALEGKKAEFSDDGYVITQEFPIYGGFATEIVERWNSFYLCAKGSDKISMTVKPEKDLNPKVTEKIQEGMAEIETLEDGTRKITYFGKDRGKFLDLDDVRACAANVLKQIMESVSFIGLSEGMTEK